MQALRQPSAEEKETQLGSQVLGSESKLLSSCATMLLHHPLPWLATVLRSSASA